MLNLKNTFLGLVVLKCSKHIKDSSEKTKQHDRLVSECSRFSVIWNLVEYFFLILSNAILVQGIVVLQHLYSPLLNTRLLYILVTQITDIFIHLGVLVLTMKGWNVYYVGWRGPLVQMKIIKQAQGNRTCSWSFRY